MRLVVALAVLILGCRKAPPFPDPLPDVASEVPESAEVPEPDRVATAALVGPARFSGGGLALDVPAGWRAWPRSGDGVVNLLHASGVEVRVRKPDAVPAVGSDCAWRFEDTVGRHRDVPVLYPASTATCVPRDPAGPVIQVWWGRLDGDDVQVEVHYPPGTLSTGKDAATAVLGSLGPG